MQPNNVFFTPEKDSLASPFHHISGESWEKYLQFDSENTFSPLPPDPEYSHTLFDKPSEFTTKMEEECNVSYNDSEYPQNFNNFGQDLFARRQPSKSIYDNQYPGAQTKIEQSDCSRHGLEEEEDEARSISTRESFVPDSASACGESPSGKDQDFSLGAEIKAKVREFMQDKPEEEKRYVNRVMPHLISSVKEILQNNHLPITTEMISLMIRDLLHGKDLMIGAERRTLREAFESEMDQQRSSRPLEMVTEDDLGIQNRKVKKAPKGNKNSSSVNHLNENYVSNIFQFAKRNFPQDKEIQRIGNERNVSAVNFRNLMSTRLSDSIMERRAKARMIGCGRELVENIEYWMKDGYFNQCNDREKYILYKEKALKDLALLGQH